MITSLFADFLNTNELNSKYEKAIVFNLFIFN